MDTDIGIDKDTDTDTDMGTDTNMDKDIGTDKDTQRIWRISDIGEKFSLRSNIVSESVVFSPISDGPISVLIWYLS